MVRRQYSILPFDQTIVQYAPTERTAHIHTVCQRKCAHTKAWCCTEKEADYLGDLFIYLMGREVFL